MKPGKYQRSKQRCQDLGWKVYDRAQSFVCSHTLWMSYVTNTFLLVSSSRSKQLLCFVYGQGQKANKYVQQRTLSGFKTIPLYYLWSKPGIFKFLRFEKERQAWNLNNLVINFDRFDENLISIERDNSAFFASCTWLPILQCILCLIT